MGGVGKNPACYKALTRLDPSPLIYHGYALMKKRKLGRQKVEKQ